jgi:hypothetical protein
MGVRRSAAWHNLKDRKGFSNEAQELQKINN